MKVFRTSRIETSIKEKLSR